jgi:hypothetical protein
MKPRMTYNSLLTLLGMACMLICLSALVLAPEGVAAAVPPQEQTVTPTTAPPGTLRDRCEQNDTLVQPCAIPTEVETADLTFVDDAIDVYSVLLKPDRTYTIRASSTSGIDPAITVFLAGATEHPLAQNDDLAPGSVDAVVQLTAAAAGWYLLQVENTAPGDMYGRTYSLSVRSSAPQGSTATPGPTADPPGDAFENNYRIEDAPRLAWGVPYDLSLVCPEARPGACVSGDHDFFLVQTKAGIPLAALSYDLGPGADTTLAVYRPAPGQTDAGTGLPGWRLVQGNDDAVRGRTLQSQILLTPDWNGDALLIIAPSGRAEAPRVPDGVGPAGRYRLIVGSPFLPAVQQVLAAQQDRLDEQGAGPLQAPSGTPVIPVNPAIPGIPPLLPAATVLPIGQPAPGDAEEIIHEACLVGLARVVIPEGARFSSAAVPASDSRYLMIYPKDSEVFLLGSCYLGWVKVRPATAVSPGWMYAPDLELIEVTSHTGDAAEPDPTPDMAETATEEPPSNLLVPRPIRIQPLPTAPVPPPTALPRQALSITVLVVDEERMPRPHIRVQLIDVLGRVRREGATDAAGRLTLVADLAASAAAWVQIPAAGLTVQFDRSAPEMTIVVPRG